jgi:hypothetical protein
VTHGLAWLAQHAAAVRHAPDIGSQVADRLRPVAGWVVVSGLVLAGCAQDTFTVAPAAADRPTIWLWVVNRDDGLAMVEFSGTTRGQGGESTIDVPACTAGVWRAPIEESWRIVVNGETILESSEVRRVTVDSVASITVNTEGIARATRFTAGGRPPDPPPPGGCG